jgi:NADPH2:quinone reductase
MPIQALIVDPSAPDGMRLAQIPAPIPDTNEVVVEVHHVALNRGDLNDARSGRIPPGGVLGNDVSGVVSETASTGGGPAVGARVVALSQGAFAERVAVDVTALAEVPGECDLGDAASLPVAGLAALRALRACGPLSGKRVLVTGASGGVGRFAVQLAAKAGAYVIASVGSPERGEGLVELGAAEVVTGLQGIGAVEAVIENVGGPQLVASWQLLATGGNLQSIGWTSDEPATFPPYATIGPAKSLSSFLNEGPYSADLATLVDLLRDGVLTPQTGWRGPFEQLPDAVAALRARSVNGKAVLDLAAAGSHSMGRR